MSTQTTDTNHVGDPEAVPAPDAAVSDATEPTYDKNAWLTKRTLQVEEVYVESLDTWVTVQELTAATVAQIGEACTRMKGSDFKIDQLKQRVMTFAAGVVKPKFDEQEANVLAHQHGSAFSVVVGVIDAISGTSDEAVEKARSRFRPRR